MLVRNDMQWGAPRDILGSGEVPALDGLRAVSVLIVMVSHSGLGWIVPGGFGVTMFFFISGFIITTLLVREQERRGGIAIGHFYWRRLLRLYPALVVFMTVIVGVHVLFAVLPDKLGIAGGLLYFMNYLAIWAPARVLHVWHHLWSLAVEAHFYLFYPWLFVWLAPSLKRLAVGLAVVCATALLVRLSASALMADKALVYEIAYQASEARIDSIAYGALCAALLLGPSGGSVARWMTHPALVVAGTWDAGCHLAAAQSGVPGHATLQPAGPRPDAGRRGACARASLQYGTGVAQCTAGGSGRLAQLFTVSVASCGLRARQVYDGIDGARHSARLGSCLRAGRGFLLLGRAADDPDPIPVRLAAPRRGGAAAARTERARGRAPACRTPCPIRYQRIAMTPHAPPQSLDGAPLAIVDGWPIHLANAQDSLETLIAAAERGEGFMFAPLNLDLLVKLRHDAAFVDAMRKARFVIADGAPVAVLARRQNPRIERTTGADLVLPLVEACAARGLPIYLLGSTPEVLDTVSRRLVEHCGGRLRIVGTGSPMLAADARGPAADAAIAAIKESGARLCFLAFGAPKQEILAARALDQGARTGFVCVGAGLDFIAGAQLRAPWLMRNFGMEWLWRLVTNPRRLARRYALCARLLGEIALIEPARRWMRGQKA